MRLKLCTKCKRPFMASEEFCPRCPEPFDANSFANLGCIVLTILPLLVLILFWAFIFGAIFYRIAARF
ncbi:MAG: hypothetical protein H0U87_00315 [Acidobacteria bacterium]|jgi:hypothetical protein|nr:hypothetical protein [Acidobacteriota bacterium]